VAIALAKLTAALAMALALVCAANDALNYAILAALDSTLLDISPLALIAIDYSSPLASI